MDTRVSRPVLEALLAEAARAAPEECCGLLLGEAGRIEEARPAANVAADPPAISRSTLRRWSTRTARRAAGGPQVLGYYHSHPAGPAEPSATDRAQAAHDGSVWAIVGEGGVTFWRDEGAGFVPLSYTR